MLVWNPDDILSRGLASLILDGAPARPPRLRRDVIYSTGIRFDLKTAPLPGGAPAQKIKLIEETIDRQIRPILRRDNGDLELHDVDGDRVFVKFVGACVSCLVSTVTLKDVVETQLREAVSDDIVVEAV